jgi:outer membrane protein TolC
MPGPKKFTVKLLLTAFLALSASSSAALAQEPIAEPLTLDRAIEIALANNRRGKNARLDVEKANDKLAVAKTRRLPNFNVTSSISQPLTTFDTTFEKGVFGTFPSIGPIPSEDTVIKSSTSPTTVILGQVSQPITQLRRIGLQIKQQETAIGISEAQLSATQQSIVNDVKHAYYAILQTQGSFEEAEANIKLYRELDRVTGEYVLQQVALRTELMDVQTKLARADYEVLSLSNQLASQKEQLNLLLGRDVNTEFSVSDAAASAQVMMRETSLVEARQRALAQRPELREARLRVENAKLDKRVKKSEFIPDVSITLNYAQTISSSNFIPKSVSGVGVQVDWEVFDWGRKKRELAEKERTITQAGYSLEELESQVLMEVNSRYRRVMEACQLLRIARLAQNASRANVQMAAYKYKLDAVLLKDVLHAQTVLADSNNEYHKALLSFWTAKADFEKAMGEDK